MRLFSCRTISRDLLEMRMFVWDSSEFCWLLAFLLEIMSAKRLLLTSKLSSRSSMSSVSSWVWELEPDSEGQMEFLIYMFYEVLMMGFLLTNQSYLFLSPS